MAGGSRGQHAIHHIEAEAGVLDDLFRSSDSHQITRLVGGKILQRGFDHLAGERTGLADAETSDSVAGEADVDGAESRFAAQFEIHTALDDAKERLGEAVSSF